MRYKQIAELKRKLDTYLALEGEVAGQLVAVDMIGDLNHGLFDEDTTMTYQEAMNLIPTIDHEEIGKVDCDYGKVYDDLQDYMTTVLDNVDKAATDLKPYRPKPSKELAEIMGLE